MAAKYRLLFVCLGNICRSPAAEGIMLTKLHKLDIASEFIVDSAGTYGGHAGDFPDPRMRKHAAARGYILNSRSRKFYPSADFANFDLIIAMDNQNVDNLNRLAVTEEEHRKICKMTDFCRRYANYNEVPDPYYTGATGFELVLDLLEDASDGLIAHLLEA